MAIKVNQFSIKAQVNDEVVSESFGEKESSEPIQMNEEMEQELIQKCFEKVLDYLKNEKDRY